MEFADLALGQRYDFYAGELRLLEEAGDVLLVPRKAIQRLGQNNVGSEPPRVCRRLFCLSYAAMAGCSSEA
jgi:hypothetical protein